MYTVTVIFLAILVLVIYFCLRSRRERRRMEIWVASQPPEVVISGRQKAVERARALLQEQNDCKAFFVDCKDFFYEFGQSQDPKIRELADTVEGFAHESDEFSYSVESIIIDLEPTDDRFRVRKDRD